MTIKIPKPNFGDRLLALIGKRRAIRMPFEVYEKLGPYVFAQAKRESFCRALFRPRDAPPPNGLIDWEEFIKEFRNEKE